MKTKKYFEHEQVRQVNEGGNRMFNQEHNMAEIIDDNLSNYFKFVLCDDQVPTLHSYKTKILGQFLGSIFLKRWLLNYTGTTNLHLLLAGNK